MGYAPDATIVALRISDFHEESQNTPMFHLSNALIYAAEKRIPIVNMSLTSFTGGDVMAGIWDHYAKTGGLMIQSAGNYQEERPRDADSVTDLNINSIIFVVSLSSGIENYRPAIYTNLAGDMKHRTVTAPGSNFTTMVDGEVDIFSGTSSAAPVVSALAATILSKWPQLTGQQVGDVILNTARDIGDPGPDEVFGMGLVDFRAALSPVNPVLSNGFAQTGLTGSVMRVPIGIGSASLRTALADVTVLDAYGRDFNGSLSGLVVQPERTDSDWMRRRLAQMTSSQGHAVGLGRFAGSFGYMTNQPSFFDTGHTSRLSWGDVSYKFGATNVRAGFHAHEALHGDLMGLAPMANGTLAYAPQATTTFGIDRNVSIGRIGMTFGTGRMGDSRADTITLAMRDRHSAIRASLIQEQGSVFGAVSDGGLALARGARTMMIEATHSIGLGSDWDVEGYGSVGATRLRIDPTSLVTDASALVGTRLGVQARGTAFGGLVAFGIAQPLTIERGRAGLTVGSGYDLEGRSLIHERRTVDLRTETRRTQLTAGFAKSSRASSLRLGVAQAIGETDTRAALSYRLRF